MVQLNGRQCTANRPCRTSKTIPNNPPGVASSLKRSRQQTMEDDLVAQLSAYLTLAIRDEARDILLREPRLAGRNLGSPELDDILRQILDKRYRESPSDGSSQAQNWRKLVRLFELVSIMAPRDQRIQTSTITKILASISKPEISRGGQLLLQLIPHPYLCLLKPCLLAIVKFICFLEPFIHMFDQYSTTGRLLLVPPAYDPISYLFPNQPKELFWSEDVPYLIQEGGITKIDIGVEGHEVFQTTDLERFDWTDVDPFSLSLDTDECTNVTIMSFSRYEIASAHLVEAPLPKGDCVFIPSLSFAEISIARMIFSGDIDNHDAIELIDDWMPTNENLVSLFLSSMSLLTIAMSWISSYHIRKFLAPLGNLVTAANFVRITSQFDSLTMWCLRHPSLLLNLNQLIELRRRTFYMNALFSLKADQAASYESFLEYFDLNFPTYTGTMDAAVNI
ncbi:hypothetical protein ONS95_005392 [Cadophora gregata]|uniref:uncharacterized protein n=1 Tax=Cadophora gregata TaxID=51156 RepID=UPI0026DB07A4|nr:uncharacterized protein ONS95_005392 [Cadophora gregata]KAK0103366.1 hypothetical protein ONS95_005392 [Cadophora gregata]KAK0107557.1 hypothetical protein ONS96_003363 [Cadophora gregata f. sp. sojae]